jgi:hypothetical protein
LVKSVLLVSLGIVIGVGAMFAIFDPIQKFFHAPVLALVGPAAPTVVTPTAPTIESIRQKGVLQVL